MNYAYIRVSTNYQTVQNQKIAIKQYAKLNHLKNINWISETISGTKNPEKRKLGELVRNSQKGDVIIVTELSRLGRSLIMILNVLQTLLEKEVKVIAIKEGYELGDNIQSKVLAFAFGLSAEIERSLLSERTKQGLERARLEGKHIGRKAGQKSKKYKLTGKGAYIKRQRLLGRSKLSLAHELNATWITLNKFMINNKIISIQTNVIIYYNFIINIYYNLYPSPLNPYIITGLPQLGIPRPLHSFHSLQWLVPTVPRRRTSLQCDFCQRSVPCHTIYTT